jgi:hypothetical protein
VTATVVILDLAELEQVVEQAVSRAVRGQEKATTAAAWLDIDAAAEYLGLTAPSLRSMRQRGEGPCATTFPNGRVRWSVVDLDEWARSA